MKIWYTTGIVILLAALSVMTFFMFEERSSNKELESLNNDLQTEVTRVTTIAKLAMGEYYVLPNCTNPGCSDWQDDPFFVRLSAALTDSNMVDFAISPDGKNAMIKMPANEEDAVIWRKRLQLAENEQIAYFFQVTIGPEKIWGWTRWFDSAEQPVSFNRQIVVDNSSGVVEEINSD